MNASWRGWSESAAWDWTADTHGVQYSLRICGLLRWFSSGECLVSVSSSRSWVQGSLGLGLVTGDGEMDSRGEGAWRDWENTELVQKKPKCWKSEVWHGQDYRITSILAIHQQLFRCGLPNFKYVNKVVSGPEARQKVNKRILKTFMVQELGKGQRGKE